jgi:hypothetical protein
VTRLRALRSSFYSRQGKRRSLPFATPSRPGLEPTQPPNQWVPDALFPGVKRPGCEADHSFPSSAEVKNAWNCTSTHPFVFMAWGLIKYRIGLHDVVLTQAQENFMFLPNVIRVIKLRTTRWKGYIECIMVDMLNSRNISVSNSEWICHVKDLLQASIKVLAVDKVQFRVPKD